MKRISSKITIFNKKVLPIFFFGVIAIIFVLSTLKSDGTAKIDIKMLFGSILMSIFVYIIMKKLAFDMMDEVWDDEDTLLIKNKKKEVRVNFSNIINIIYSVSLNPSKINLFLKEPCEFGKKISFVPIEKGIWGILGFKKNPEIQEFVKRVVKIRGG